MLNLGIFDFLFGKKPSSSKSSNKPKIAAKTKMSNENDILVPILGIEINSSRRFVTHYQDSTGHAIYSLTKSTKPFGVAVKNHCV